MVTGNNFTLTTYLNDQLFPIENYSFLNFVIYETIHFGIYYAVLSLNNNSTTFIESPLLSGNKLKIDILFGNENKSREYKFIIHEVKLSTEIIKIVLLPEIGIKLLKDKISKGYKNKVDLILKQICSDIGITQNEIESTNLPSINILQSNQNYFSFIKSLVKKAKSENANFLFFIDKTDKLKFYSVKYLKSKVEIGLMTDDWINEIELNDDSFALQLKSGFGARGIYFDWDSGKIKDISIDKDKLSQIGNNANNKLTDKIGITTDYINKNNLILSLNPIIQNVYFDENYNSAELENEILRKNYFNIFVNFKTFCNLDLSPAELIELNFKAAKSDENKSLNGKWIIYETIHIFTLAEAVTKIKTANNFIYNDRNVRMI